MLPASTFHPFLCQDTGELNFVGWYKSLAGSSVVLSAAWQIFMDDQFPAALLTPRCFLTRDKGWARMTRRKKVTSESASMGWVPPVDSSGLENLGDEVR